MTCVGWKYQPFQGGWETTPTPEAASILRRRNLKTEVQLWKRFKCFPSTLRRRNLKTQQSPVNLEMFVGEQLSRKAVLKLFFVHTKTQSQRFQIPPVQRAFSKSFSVDGRKKERKKERKLRFEIPLAWCGRSSWNQVDNYKDLYGESCSPGDSSGSNFQPQIMLETSGYKSI